MTLPSTADLSRLSEQDLKEAAIRLDLPHLPAFLESIGRAQSALNGGTVRTYLRDLIDGGGFDIISPTSARVIRSGSSLVLTDKTVVFSFPAEPSLLLGVGDIGLGWPICAALLTDRHLLLKLVSSDWGFSERHLPGLATVIKTSGWVPAPATKPLRLVLGDPNFAHHAWNELSALEELTRGDLPDGIEMVATHQPLGPIHDIFPEIAKWPLTVITDVDLQSVNAPGSLFAPIGGRFINKGLIGRLLAFAETQASERCRELRASLATIKGPVLWMSVRTRNRTATNQHEMLAALGYCFLKAAPDGAVIIDGFSLPADLANAAPYHRDDARAVVAGDHAAAERLREALEPDGSTGRAYVAVGLSIPDSLVLSQHADIYFCHHGTVQHKIGWFTSLPGMAHCNRVILDSAPAAWVAAQSEVAVPPLYLSPDIVADVGLDDGAKTEFSHLLRQENYMITSIPSAIKAFFRHSADAKVTPGATPGNIMAYMDQYMPSEKLIALTTDLVPDPHLAAEGWSPTRHVLPVPENLVPGGTLYTDFFRFVDTNLRPRAYFEIGTHFGHSVKSFTCNAVCVDPHFMLDQDVLAGRPETHFYQMPSDTFFSNHDLRGIFETGPDICFLDGMHRSEYLLRDFINTERLCHRRSIIFMHDCLPVNARMARRTHELGDASEGPWQHAWTGDVWKIVPLLKSHRPDLKIFVLDCAPTGLVAVTNLDPASTILTDGYGRLVDELRELDLKTYTIRRLWENAPVISSRSLVDHPEDLTLFLDIH